MTKPKEGITIDEAIEHLSGYVYEEKPCLVGLFDEATRLGIEALKRFRDFRPTKYPIPKMLLPGETKERRK